MTRTTVVGYDGSPAAKAAVNLAAARAGEGGTVRAVDVVSAPSDFIETPYYERMLEHARERAESAVEELEPDAPENVTVEIVVDGAPARKLVELARHAGADEIAVGSRGFGPVTAAVLGSTAHALLHEADRPVLVLSRKAVDEGRPVPARGAAVVVGFDGSDHARAALEYARRRAEESGGPLVAVVAFDAPSDWLGRPYYQRALDQHGEHARELVAELEREAGTELETDLVHGSPAEALARAADARDAAEIVVGSRGRGRFRGAIGSVSHALLNEAHRPVVIVPLQDRG